MKPYIVFLSPEQLQTRSTKTLLYIFKKARAAMHKAHNRFICDTCHDEHGMTDEDQEFVDSHDRYVNRVKSVLSGREHVS